MNSINLRSKFYRNSNADPISFACMCDGHDYAIDYHWINNIASYLFIPLISTSLLSFLGFFIFYPYSDLSWISLVISSIKFKLRLIPSLLNKSTTKKFISHSFLQSHCTFFIKHLLLSFNMHFNISTQKLDSL